MSDEHLPQIVVLPSESRTEYVTREVTVHEHRAPTDESVRLLKEMETAARDKIDQSIRLDGNGFECVVEIMLDNMSDQRIARAVFVLNGKRMDAEARVSRREDSPATLAGALRDAVAQRLAAEILMPAIFGPLQRVYR